MMILSTLILVFVCLFLAAVAFGHALLLGDFWSGLFAAEQRQGRETTSEDAMKVPAE